MKKTRRFTTLAMAGIITASSLFTNVTAQNHPVAVGLKDTPIMGIEIRNNDFNYYTDFSSLQGIHTIESGKITEIKKKDNNIYSIRITRANGDLIVNAYSDVLTFDTTQNKVIKVKNLKKNMQISVAIPKNGVIINTLPAEANDVNCIVVMHEFSNFKLGLVNDNLAEINNKFKIVTNKNTKILNTMSPIQKLEKDDIKKTESLVLYRKQSAPIPVDANKKSRNKIRKMNQVTPSAVIVLSNESDLIYYNNQLMNNENEFEQDGENTFNYYVKLNSRIAANKGYTLEQYDDIITLSKNDIWIELKLDSTEFYYEHKTADIHPLDSMERLALPPVKEGKNILVPNSFIDALQ